MSTINYEDFEDEEFHGGRIKTKSKGNLDKKRAKGHQGRYEKSEREAWAEMKTLDSCFQGKPAKKHFQKPADFDDKKDVDFKDSKPFQNKPSFQKPSQPQQSFQKPRGDAQRPQEQGTQPTGHVFGPNTREINKVKIDMDGVANIEKVENVQNGQTTFGIKFIFKGTKGFSRTIWFNINVRARDAVYNAEYEFWANLNRR